MQERQQQHIHYLQILKKRSMFTCRSLKDCVPTILEVLVGLIGDEYSHVALYSRKILETFSMSQLGQECRPLVEMLEENLHQLTVSLPRLIRSSGECCHMMMIS